MGVGFGVEVFTLWVLLSGFRIHLLHGLARLPARLLGFSGLGLGFRDGELGFGVYLWDLGFGGWCSVFRV